ncbi:YcbK family protein [Aliihoeflea sp. PC F10.4]
MSANAARPSAFGRIMLAALTATLLASCSATSDTDGALFGFSPEYGAAGVPGQAPQQTTETAQAPAADGTDTATPQQAEMAASAGEAENASPTAETAALNDAAPSAENTSVDTADAPPSEPVQGEAAASGGEAQTVAEEPKAEPAKRGFLSAFFSPQQTAPAPAALAPQQTAAAPAALAPQQNTAAPAPASRPIVDLEDNQPALASAATAARPAMVDAASFGNDALPGVRDNAGLFEISRRNGIDDDSDIDMLEGGGLYQVAYAPGLARLAPNGLLRQREDVEVGCFRPELVAILRAVESRFGKKVIVTSGYRSPEHNRRVRGARASQHMACAAADIHVPGVHKLKVAEFVRAMPRRGGVGTYCHTEAIHVDTGPERDWNWRCRRKG